jgi:hypothetical protein
MQAPELAAKKAALPTQKVIRVVQTWLKRISELPESECPILTDDAAPSSLENSQQDAPPASPASSSSSTGNKKKKEKVYDWREVAKFDNAITLELLTELQEIMNPSAAEANKKKTKKELEEEDEVKYGALTRAISRYDQRPGKCFSKDILCGILNAAANCYDILLPRKPAAQQKDDDDDSSSSPPGTPQSKKPKDSPPVNTMMIGPTHCLLTKLQCYCIMSLSFLSIFPRASMGCVDASGDLPSMNLNEMFEMYDPSPVGPIVNAEKLLMFFEYYAISAHRAFREGDPKMVSDRFGVVFIRGITPRNIPPFGDSKFRDCAMGDLSVMELRKSIDDQKHTIRVDFANAIVGGASLSFGCVQEEIMFAECPEMNCARWMNPTMKENEAILICRAEQYSTHAGYAHSLIYQGPHQDGEADILSSAVLAVDAYDYRGRSTGVQYSPKAIEREFNKLAAAMDACEVARVVYGIQLPSTICTGNWGCGVFRGDAELKAIVQWLTFSIFGMKTLYCPFDNAALQQRLKDISICANARKNKLNCAEVGEFLMKVGKIISSSGRGEMPMSVCDLFAQNFEMDLEMAGESLYSAPRKMKIGG